MWLHPSRGAEVIRHPAKELGRAASHCDCPCLFHNSQEVYCLHHLLHIFTQEHSLQGIISKVSCICGRG